MSYVLRMCDDASPSNEIRAQFKKFIVKFRCDSKEINELSNWSVVLALVPVYAYVEFLATIEPFLIPYLIFKWEFPTSCEKYQQENFLMNFHAHRARFDFWSTNGIASGRCSWMLMPFISCLKKFFTTLSALIWFPRKSIETKNENKRRLTINIAWHRIHVPISDASFLLLLELEQKVR